MELKDKTVEELEARKAEIGAEYESLTDIETVEARSAELDSINAEIESRESAEKAKAEIREKIAQGEGKVVAKFNETHEERKTMNITELRSSNEYAKAFASFVRSGMKDDAEVRGMLLSANVDGGYVPVPTFLETEIKTAWENHQVMGLVKKTNFKGNVKVGFELTATGAVVHTEGTNAPTEEAITLGTVELKAENIKKWITVSDEAIEGTTVDTLGYIYKEMAHRIVEKAEELVLAKIAAAPATADATHCGVEKYIVATPAADTVCNALAKLCGEAQNLRIVMNRQTYPVFRALELAGNYNIDVFEGLKDRIVYSDKIAPFSSVTAGNPYMIIGDFSDGFQCNFPNGNDLSILMDNLSLAEKDLVKIVGRQYVGMGVVADKRFVNICKAASAG